MADLTQRDLYVFTTVVDTILPAIEGSGPAWTTPGGELGLAARLPSIFDRLPHDKDRGELKLFLGLLNSAAGGLLLYGRPVAFTRLDGEERAEAFRKMSAHSMSLVRKGAIALKTLAAFLWMATEDPDETPAAWEAISYPGPDGPAPQIPKRLTPEPIAAETMMSCDVVVVGSGAGGGVAAAVLAEAGLDVVILEKGGYHSEADFTHLEADAYKRLYLDGVLSSTADGGITMVAGSTLGGGTVVNYTTSFDTPASVREEWDRVGGFERVFTGDAYAESMAQVGSRLEVNTDSEPSPRDVILEKGLREMGWHVGALPRNTVGCTGEDCGYCTMGCRIGAKRSTLATYLEDAHRDGARIVVGAHVDMVTTDEAGVTGVTATVSGHRLTVRARAVVLAAGALSTPAILLRSKLGGRAVGRHLRLHPVTVVWARFDDRVDPWTGRLQTRYTDEFADLDGQGHGFKLETAPLHPLFPAAFIGWEDGAGFKHDVLGLANLGLAGVLLRDRDHGRVVIRRDGSPVWRYEISPYDQAHVRVGVGRAAEVLAAAGAVEVLSSTVRPVRWSPGSAPVDSFVEAVDAVGYGSNRTRYFSFHQMGTARMGSDPAQSVVDDANESHHTPGLYVMDASCFPTASGVNPMLTIVAIAHRGAKLLAERLG
ncbi:MAG: GMC family oxidoreductase [Actinobacteria bacterium]|nr:GMC family oxidoreductase [Actinomycetota bacterium]